MSYPIDWLKGAPEERVHRQGIAVCTCVYVHTHKHTHTHTHTHTHVLVLGCMCVEVSVFCLLALLRSYNCDQGSELWRTSSSPHPPIPCDWLPSDRWTEHTVQNIPSPCLVYSNFCSIRMPQTLKSGMRSLSRVLHWITPRIHPQKMKVVGFGGQQHVLEAIFYTCWKFRYLAESNS